MAGVPDELMKKLHDATERFHQARTKAEHIGTMSTEQKKIVASTLRAAEKELDRMRLANARAAAANAVAGAELIGKVRVVAQRMAGGMSAADLRTLVGDIRGKLGSDPAVVALVAEGEDDTVPFVVAVSPAAQDLGLRANELVKQLGAAVNGRGGGKADLAQGSGKGAAGIDAALAAVRAEIGRS